MRAINRTPRLDVYVHRGAPKPMVIMNRVGPSAYGPFPSTLKVQCNPGGGAPFVLAVGSGITLSSYDGVADAMATIQLSVAQSRLVPLGNASTYEVQEGGYDADRALMAGALIGEYGNNPDG
jgi:hypothetical protein